MHTTDLDRIVKSMTDELNNAAGEWVVTQASTLVVLRHLIDAGVDLNEYAYADAPFARIIQWDKEADDPIDGVKCPDEACGGDVVEVDASSRDNTIEVSTPDDDAEWAKRNDRTDQRPYLTIHQGSDGDGYATTHYQCQTCGRVARIPDDVEIGWA